MLLSPFLCQEKLAPPVANVQLRYNKENRTYKQEIPNPIKKAVLEVPPFLKGVQGDER